jgi:peptidoglycan/LPS O-acetylase OafA/YrhL
MYCRFAIIVMLFLGVSIACAGLMAFGAFVLFWLAFQADIGGLQKIKDQCDISYGVYLYGWPISTMIIVFWSGVGPVEIAACTLLLALGFGAASWWGLEPHTRRLARALTSRGARALESV